jgi:hypothetical protein
VRGIEGAIFRLHRARSKPRLFTGVLMALADPEDGHP